MMEIILIQTHYLLILLKRIFTYYLDLPALIWETLTQKSSPVQLIWMEIQELITVLLIWVRMSLYILSKFLLISNLNLARTLLM